MPDPRTDRTLVEILTARRSSGGWTFNVRGEAKLEEAKLRARQDDTIVAYAEEAHYPTVFVVNRDDEGTLHLEPVFQVDDDDNLVVPAEHIERH